MLWFNKNKFKIFIVIAAISILCLSFFYGANSPDSKSKNYQTISVTNSDVQSTVITQRQENISSSIPEDIFSTKGNDNYETVPVAEKKPAPVEAENTVVTDKSYSCTISISCTAINDNISLLNPDKIDLVPKDGWILKPTEVTFYEGESVFNVLLRTCKQQKIHMEYVNTPIYNSAYIEGINNLYEFDCGELSGWMYKVNGGFPNYGCSHYQLQDGDIMELVYTCDLGNDIGGNNDLDGLKHEE